MPRANGLKHRTFPLPIFRRTLEARLFAQQRAAPERMGMSWYRLAGLLLIQLVSCVVALSLAAFFRDYGGWLIGLWFVAMLWWMAASAARNTMELEKRESARKARREAAKQRRLRCRQSSRRHRAKAEKQAKRPGKPGYFSQKIPSTRDAQP
jgi:hypothetical protein